MILHRIGLLVGHESNVFVGFEIFLVGEADRSLTLASLTSVDSGKACGVKSHILSGPFKSI